MTSLTSSSHYVLRFFPPGTLLVMNLAGPEESTTFLVVKIDLCNERIRLLRDDGSFERHTKKNLLYTIKHYRDLIRAYLPNGTEQDLSALYPMFTA